MKRCLLAVDPGQKDGRFAARVPECQVRFRVDQDLHRRGASALEFALELALELALDTWTQATWPQDALCMRGVRP